MQADNNGEIIVVIFFTNTAMISSSVQRDRTILALQRELETYLDCVRTEHDVNIRLCIIYIQ